MQKITHTEYIKNVKNLSTQQLAELSNEIREEILFAVDKNGGHLSANLGIVETTVALYHVFDFPNDKLIFDVGHQCYAHKILSGRDGFENIREENGLSGFPDRKESEYDCFGTGHAGTSISSALGLCTARDYKGGKERVIAVVGDGALCNGLNLEAITTNTEKPKNLIVILNDNGMSISKNKNGLYRILSKRTIKKDYVKGKRAIKKIFGANGIIVKGFAAIKNFIKRILSKDDYFEKFGFKYVGIVDGNNVKELATILERVKRVAEDRAVLVHIKTTKGKGLLKAEQHADDYHGVGKELKMSSGGFSVCLGETLNELIEKDKSIVTVCAGMKTGTGLAIVENKFPQNFFDVGIAEEYAVTFSAGLAVGGIKPVVAIYSTFLQRAYDQVLHDVCLQNLPVIFCLDRAGFVGEDGKTHQGLFDLCYLLHIPNLTVIAPNGKDELKSALTYALKLNSPVAIRYPKDCGEDGNENIEEKPFLTVKDSKDPSVTVLAVGPKMKKVAMDYAENNEKARVVSARVIKPLDVKFLESVKDGEIVVTLEENAVIGGFGSLIAEYFSAKNVKVICMGAKDFFVEHGTIKSQIEKAELTADGIKEKVKDL